jgi:hypothetical protein
MKQTLVFIFYLCSFYSFSQIVNSNKNTINDFYDAQVKNVELNGAKATIQLRLKKWTTPYTYVSQPAITSAVKNSAFFLNLGVTNTSTFLNLNKFDFKKNNGYTFGIAYQHAFNEIYLASTPASQNPHQLQAFFLSLDYQMDKFENYDPTTSDIATATPDKVVLKGGYSLYKFKYRDDAKFKFAWVPSLYGKINLIGYNEDKLQNYLLNSSTTQVDDIIFTGSTVFDGKYGVVDNDIKSAQISFSLPFVPDKPFIDLSFISLPIISPIPYVSYEVFDNNNPRINAGFALGLLSSSLLDATKTPKGGGIFQAFNVPSYLTIGVDWNNQGDYSSHPNYFVSGSIKLK